MRLANRFSFEVSHKSWKVDFDTIVNAAANICLLGYLEPVVHREVDCLSYVEAKVEPRVVGGGPTHHELALLMQTFRQSKALLMQGARIDKRCLVADELFAPLEVLRELALHVGLEGLVVAEVNRVPELGLAVVQVVDAVEVEVLLVPAEHRLPRAYVHVGVCDALDSLVHHAFAQDGIQLCQVPGDALVKKGARDVCAIQRCVVYETSPELKLLGRNQLTSFSICSVFLPAVIRSHRSASWTKRSRVLLTFSIRVSS